MRLRPMPALLVLTVATLLLRRRLTSAAGAIRLMPTSDQAAAAVGDAPGRPRFVLAMGGTARHGSASSEGLEDEIVMVIGRQTIGRAADADIRLHEATVSLRHAEVEVTVEGLARLRDLGADNGVMVDGRPVHEAQLSDGNRVELGEVVLVFKSDLALGAPGRQGGELG